MKINHRGLCIFTDRGDVNMRKTPAATPPPTSSESNENKTANTTLYVRKESTLKREFTGLIFIFFKVE